MQANIIYLCGTPRLCGSAVKSCQPLDEVILIDYLSMKREVQGDTCRRMAAIGRARAGF